MELATREDLVETSSETIGSRRNRAARAQIAVQPAIRFGSALEKGVVIVLATAVVGTALASGAVEPWSVALFELTVVLLILLWAGKCLAERRVVIGVPAAAVPMSLLVLMGLAQGLALKDSDGGTASLSLDVEATRSAALAVFFLLVCFLAGANLLVARKRVRTIVRCLVMYGLVMAVFGLVQHLSQEGRTYWLRPQSQGASWFGPFVNHAHFAGYMTLLLPLPIGLMMNRAVRSEERFWFGFAAAMMGLSVIVSLSRGGMIALAAELLFLLIACWASARRPIGSHDQHSRYVLSARPHFKSMAALAVITISIGLGVFWLGPEPVASRIARGNGARGERESLYESRGWIWRDSMRVFEAHPLLGVGMGAFETAFPMYSKSDGSLLVSQSHSDYLQVLTDCGILGGLLAMWFIVAVWFNVFNGLRSHDSFSRSLSLGCGAAIFGMMVHSLFDFNLQLPSTALLFLLICAIASAAGERPGGQRWGGTSGTNIAMGPA
jgi:O-antigen ligase